MKRPFGSGGGRGALVALAFVAFAVQVMLPAGFMLVGAGGGPAVVICTGHGPVQLAPGDRHLPPSKSRSAGLCVFAGHAGGPLLAGAPTPDAIGWALAASPTPAAYGFTQVGRALAAPPPARGPPPVLV